MKRLTPKDIARAVPVERAYSSVVAKRKANNDRSGKRSYGLRNKVTDNDPMEKDSESNWP